MCERQSRDNKHNIKDCIHNVEVSMGRDGSLHYAKGKGRALNTCVKGAHIHQTYAKLVDCYKKGDGGIEVIEEFERLEEQGAVPCPQATSNYNLPMPCQILIPP